MGLVVLVNAVMIGLETDAKPEQKPTFQARALDAAAAESSCW